MKIRVVHWSDHHGERRKIPSGDLYINSGDSNPNFPVWDLPRSLQKLGRYKILAEQEAEKQKRWVEENPVILPNNNPVITVRGNHDFTGFAQQYPNNPVYDIQPDENPYSMTFDVLGLRIGGFRGINWLGGSWSDELRDHQWAESRQYWDRNWDIVVTHSPPRGILDKVWVENCGSSEYWRYLNERFYDHLNPPKLCCFGHIHEFGGKTLEMEGTIFSNAACEINIIDLEI